MSLNKKLKGGLYTGAFLTAVVGSYFAGDGVYNKYWENPLNSESIQEEIVLSNSINLLDEARFRSNTFSREFLDDAMQENLRLTRKHQDLVSNVTYQRAIEKREKFLSAILISTAGGLIGTGIVFAGCLGILYKTSPIREIDKVSKQYPGATGLI